MFGIEDLLYIKSERMEFHEIDGFAMKSTCFRPQINSFVQRD